MAAPSLSLVVLKTDQIEALKSFYKVVGIELAQEQHGKGPVHFAGQVGSAVLEIYPLTRDAAVDATTRLGFVVDDLVRVVEALESLGSVIAARPQVTEWGHRAVARDPDGRSVELYQR